MHSETRRVFSRKAFCPHLRSARLVAPGLWRITRPTPPRVGVLSGSLWTKVNLSTLIFVICPFTPSLFDVRHVIGEREAALVWSPFTKEAKNSRALDGSRPHPRDGFRRFSKFHGSGWIGLGRVRRFQLDPTREA